MKKYLPIIIVALLSGSCKIYKAVSILSSSKITVDTTTKLFFSNADKSMVTCLVDGKKTEMVFDLGANANLLGYIPDNIGQYKKLVGHATGIDGKRTQNIVCAVPHFETVAFKWKSAPFVVVDAKAGSVCGQQQTINVLGASILQANQRLFLNYKDGYLQFVGKRFDLSDYREVKCRFGKNGLVYIILKVNGTEHEFMFDTGNSLGMILSEADAGNMKPDYELENYVVNFKNEAIISTGKAFKNVPVTVFPGMTVKAGMITQSSIKASNAGLKFIKNFNWLIDAEHEKIYCRLINEKILQDAPEIQLANQLAGISRGVLLVQGIRKNASKFHVGDRINSVQQKNITVDNMCDMLDVLNTSYNWDTLQVITERPPAVK